MATDIKPFFSHSERDFEILCYNVFMARQVKQCPKCGAMTFLETEQCHHCGHQFRTDVMASASSFNPERTQMLTLPAMFSRTADTPQMPTVEDNLTFLEPMAPRRRSALPLIAILAVVLVLLFLFVWLLTH